MPSEHTDLRTHIAYTCQHITMLNTPSPLYSDERGTDVAPAECNRQDTLDAEEAGLPAPPQVVVQSTDKAYTTKQNIMPERFIFF